MVQELNDEKIKSFYNKIIKCHEENFIKLYFGDQENFLEIIKTFEESEENIKISCNNGEIIKIPTLLFDFLFKGDFDCIFDKPVGQRYEYKDYIFVELIESPIMQIDKKTDKAGVFPITKDRNGNTESCFFIQVDINGERSYDYPEEIIPFFVSQLKHRFKNDDVFRQNFIDYFEPMEYVLKIKKDQKNLLRKILFKLGSNLGIIERYSIEDKRTNQIKYNLTII